MFYYYINRLKPNYSILPLFSTIHYRATALPIFCSAL